MLITTKARLLYARLFDQPMYLRSFKKAFLNSQVLPLRAEHAEGIHELYPANDMECHELFQRLINKLSAAGVFANGSLAAWMIQSYYGALFSMQTKPEFRRKGYGTKLAR